MNRLRTLALTVAGALAITGLTTGCDVDHGQAMVRSVTFTQTSKAKTDRAITASDLDGNVTIPAGRPGTLTFVLQVSVKDTDRIDCTQSWIEETTYPPTREDRDHNITLTYQLPAGLRSGTSTAKINCAAREQGFLGGTDKWNYVIRVTAAPTTIYWADRAGISRASLTGSGVDTDFTAKGQYTTSVAVSDTHVYYTDRGTIGRAKLDGTDDRPDFMTDVGALTVVVDGQHLFWSTRRGGIRRSDLSGGNRETIAEVPSRCDEPRDTPLAVDGAYVYYQFGCDLTFDTAIYRVPVKGGESRKVVQPPSSVAYLAVGGGYVYWSMSNRNVGRARTDGTNVQGEFITVDSGFVRDLALSHEHLYFLRADVTGGVETYWLGRSQLDGKDVQPQWLSLGQQVANGLATGPGAAEAGSGFSASPDPADFGVVKVGERGVVRVTVTNTADTPLEFVPSSVAVSGPGFGYDGYTCTHTGWVTLPPGGTCLVVLWFKPTSEGPQSGLLGISGANGEVYTVPLIGTGGTSKLTMTPNSVTFPDQTVGTTSAPRTVTVTQTAQAGTITTVTLQGGNRQFAINEEDCKGKTLTNGQTCTATVTFTPSAAGPQGASLIFWEGLTPNHIPLDGKGIASGPVFSADPGTIDFGDQPTTITYNPQTVTIRNTGGAPMTIGTVDVSGADNDYFYVVTEDCSGKTLAPTTDSCTAQLIFLPQDGRLGEYNAGLTFEDNAPGNPHTVPITGNSVNPPPPAG